jgi:hypothetical protein
MYKRVNDLFSDDESLSQVMPPRFNSEIKKKVLRNFSDKVKLLHQIEKIIGESDAVVLNLGHSYRNAAFHLDQHNPASMKTIVRLLFRSVCSIFKMSYASRVTMGGFSKGHDWLKAYDLPINILDFKEASHKIASNLSNKIRISLKEAQSALVGDLQNRLETIDTLIKTQLYSPSDKLLNELLKMQEFQANFDNNQASAKLRAANYAIIDGKPFDREVYLALENEYKAKIESGLTTFKPTFTSRRIRNFSQSLSRLSQAKPLDKLLIYYESLDKVVTQLENLIDEAITSVDRAAQFQIDLERGK